MDIVSADEIVVPDEAEQDNVTTIQENKALEIQAGDEITHDHKLTGSQSSIEYEKSGDGKRRGTGPRSKSFLEEPSRSKAALFMQRKPGGKGLRSTHGSHGDGICLWPSWDISKGFTGSESKSADQKKLQVVSADSSFQAGGVTQKLFDSNVTFADLVRVYTTQENSVQDCKVQLGNTLLSTLHASTLVSNYLNTYRSYLEHLRKTCGRGDSPEKSSNPQAPPKSVSLFLPLAGMTSVFSDDSKEDPEFLELLKKTTTESIRKLWPHSGRNTLVCKASFIEATQNKDDEVESLTGGTDDNSQPDSGNIDNYTDISLQQLANGVAECEITQYNDDNDGQQVGNCELLKITQYSFVCDNQFTPQENSNVSTNNQNYAMKFSPDTVLAGNGDSANIQNINPAQIQKGLLKTPNEALPPSKSPTESQSSRLPSWTDAGQQKSCSVDSSNGQSCRSSALDALLQHQQKLAQQQHLQRQMLQHQHQLQQQRQQQQLIHQYQQQEQQRQESADQSSSSKSYGFQSPPDPSKNWLQAVGENGGLASYRACVGSGTQPATSYKNEIAAHQMGLDSFGNSYQINSDYFASNIGQSRLSNLDSRAAAFPETSSHSRTLKASYACLDPTNPMTLSVDPLHDFNNESDVFMNPCDLYPYERQSFPSMTSNFRPSLDDRGIFPESPKMWSKISKPVSTFNDVDNSGKTLEERLHKAYARSRTSQFTQQGQWNENTPKLPIERPVVKINTLQDRNSDDSQSYSFQRAFVDPGGGRRVSNPATHGVSSSSNGGVPDRWNRLVSCPGPLNGNNTDRLMSHAPCMRDDEGGHFVPLQSSTTMDLNSGMSRLYQWKQDISPCNETNYFPALRSPTNIAGFPGTSDSSGTQSLLTGLPLDRDFSWNASPMSSHLPQMAAAQSSLFQCSDLHGLDCESGQAKMSELNMNKISLTADQRRQMSSNNNASSVMHRSQGEHGPDPGLLYDAGDAAKQTGWSHSNRQEISSDIGASALSGVGCGSVISPSMQILNRKILAAQNATKNHAEGNSGSDGDSPRGKDGEKVQSGSSSPSSVDLQPSDSLTKHRRSRAVTDPNSALCHAAPSLSQMSVLQQQQQQSRQSIDSSVFKLSEDLEKALLDDVPSTSWHELASQEGLNNDFSTDDTSCDKDKFDKLQNFNGTAMMFSEQDGASLQRNDPGRTYDAQHDQTEQRLQTSLGNQITTTQMSSSQHGTSRPRMILGANSAKQINEDKVKAEVEESNRRLRQMLGLAPPKDQCNSASASVSRINESSQQPPQTPSSGILSASQTQGPCIQSSSQGVAGQVHRMQVTGGKIQAPVGLTPQMYCVPNILMPPPSIQPQGSTRQSNVIPIQGVMTGVSSATRFPQGMIRVPFVDMSRLVYFHQMPVSLSSVHPTNNNHNNSSSSNPHVNTSNIITINTSDNDFSASGQGDKSGRHVRSATAKNKTTFLKMRSGCGDEFAVPILGMRPSLDDTMCPRLVKSRTNPWDQDLDHDFSNSLMSKTVSVDNIPGSCTPSTVAADPSFVSPDVGLVYPEVANLHGGSQPGVEQATKTATFMQWPASADMHPEMLDMLPMRRAVLEDCSSGGLCWPEMEFLMSSREQLQSARRSNKPMGSNKANLISIIPKENAPEGLVGGKETRYEKIENKLL